MNIRNGRKYAVGQFYLVGSMLQLERHGDPRVFATDVSPDEAAELIEDLRNSGYPGSVLSGVRIFTKNVKRRK